MKSFEFPVRSYHNQLLFIVVTILTAGTIACGGGGATPTPTPQVIGSGEDADWQTRWEQVLQAAQQEGSVVVEGPTSPETRREFTEVFRERFGIEVNYQSVGRGIGQRIEQEAAAGRVSIDVMIGGVSDNLFQLKPAGLLDTITDKLILPDSYDPSKWRRGELKFIDDEGEYMLQAVEYRWGGLHINADVIDPSGIQTWDDLLKPEYKGKIAWQDPRGPGPGWAIATYVLDIKGPEYVEQLFLGQEVEMIRDRRQTAEAVVRGQYPIAASTPRDVVLANEQLRANIVMVFPADAPGHLTGGSGVISLLTNSPNPNAAIVFLNWFLSQEGQEIFARTNNDLSARIDVDPTIVSAWEWIMPEEGIEYDDYYSVDFNLNRREPLSNELWDILGR